MALDSPPCPSGTDLRSLCSLPVHCRRRARCPIVHFLCVDPPSSTSPCHPQLPSPLTSHSLSQALVFVMGLLPWKPRPPSRAWVHPCGSPSCLSLRVSGQRPLSFTAATTCPTLTGSPPCLQQWPWRGAPAAWPITSWSGTEACPF